MAERTKSYNFDRLVKIVKSDGEIVHRLAAEKLGISQGQLSMLDFCKAKVEAGYEKKVPKADAKTIVKLRNDGHRWEMIAAKTDKGVSEVKSMYEEGSGKSSASSYTGRGRNFSGSTSGTSSKASSKTKAKSKSAGKTSAKASSKSKSKSKTKATGAARGTGVVRNRRRSSAASNPS